MGKNRKTYNILKLFCFSALLAGTVFLFPIKKSCAQLKGAGCAADTWIAMTNQAVLQTRREDLMNKRFIVKSRSVLQYSCFNSEITNMVANIGPIFSNNPLWNDKPVPLLYGEEHVIRVFQEGLNEGSLDAALQAVVFQSLEGYLGGSFQHTVLSNTTELVQPFMCHNMAAVWQAAKCKNFEGNTVFYEFEDLINYDPRIFPFNMPCRMPTAG